MSRQEVMKMQRSCILRVNIQCHCDGCKTKIKKLLQQIDGVYAVSVNAEQGKVTVTGNVDPNKLIKRLKKSGKHAELWGGGQNGFNNSQNPLKNQFKNMKFENGKGEAGNGGKDNKSHHKGERGQQGHHQQMQQFKGPQDLELSQKYQKSVKFNSHEDSDASEGDFYDEFDDDFGDDEEEFGHGYEHGQGHGHDHGHAHHLPKKVMPMMGKGFGMINGTAFGDKRGGGNDKKGSGTFEIPVVMKSKDGKNGNGSTKDGDGKKDEGSKNAGDVKNGRNKNAGKEKNGRKGVGGFLGFGKKDKNGGDGAASKGNRDGTTSSLGGGGRNNTNKNGSKNGGTQKNGVHHINDSKIKQGYKPGMDGIISSGGGPWNVGYMGSMGSDAYDRMASNHMQPAVQGLPAINRGYYQGMGMGPMNPYNQHQQYTTTMMNQQQHGNDMFHPMMYARPHPAVNYMPPPMSHPPGADPLTHIFSDENANSCNIM